MPSATVELEKYLHRENIPFVGDPYIEFHANQCGQELRFNGAQAMMIPFFGPATLFRFSNARWLIQWFQLGADYKRPEIRANEVLDLLEEVVRENQA